MRFAGISCVFAMGFENESNRIWDGRAESDVDAVIRGVRSFEGLW
jgi:hypothetical protein